jgi:hypothetical protein
VSLGPGKAGLGPGIAILAGVSQLFGDMSDRGKVAAELAEMFGEAGDDNVALWVVPDPEKDMEETRWVAEECRRRSGREN